MNQTIPVQAGGAHRKSMVRLARYLSTLFLAISPLPALSADPRPRLSVVAQPDSRAAKPHYPGGRAPLKQMPFLRLPISSFQPGGWLKRALELQRHGLAGQLGTISTWLTKEGNAWLRADGKGLFGWEEVPYWLRGYARIGYVLRDPAMLAEAKTWIDAVLSSQRPDGDFGPVFKDRQGRRDLWAQMIMLQTLQHYCEYSHDKRVLPFLSRYFRWQSTIPDEEFLETYWEKLRGGDNLASVYWLYDRTGERWLLNLATKIDRNTANWRMANTLPDWHVVNNAQCFRAPATYSLQSGERSDIEASYRNFRHIRDLYGQVPGGLFGADEIARPGHVDPHQAAELCSMVEQIQSDAIMLNITGDGGWADNAEDVAFNTLPAALTADYRALRYLTAPNMAASDAANHAPGVHNKGPFFLMNPFSSRCCQHNHSSAWVNYLENSWVATPDQGLAALLFHEGAVTAKAGAAGAQVTLKMSTRYPFEERVEIRVETAKPVEFPLYLRIPAWADRAAVTVNGAALTAAPARGYFKLVNTWRRGDRIELSLPMEVRLRRWAKNKDSVSVDRGPLTYSLRIAEKYVKRDSEKTAISDSKWQPGSDASKWPSYEILPASAWNYGLMLKSEGPERGFEVVRRPWPAGDYPFTLEDVPIALRARGRKLPGWGLDEHGLVAALPQSPVHTQEPVETIELVPMGAARLRISAFPVVQ